MGFQVKIQEVNVEKVNNGKGGYEVANVNYLYKGDAKTTKIMSFSNPQVFKDVQKYAGKTVSVETTQNGKYTNWAKIEVVASEDSPTSAATSGYAAPGSKTPARSTYETPEERAQRQLMIVRQSSISNSISFIKEFSSPAALEGVDMDVVLGIAQQFVDFVYKKEDLAGKEDWPDEDVPM